MRGFEIFLLVGGSANPANYLSEWLPKWDGHSNFPTAASQWALSFLKSVAFEEEIDEWLIRKWAIVESLNSASKQRLELPEKYQLGLRGSGYWKAPDTGGWYRQLMEAALEWDDLPFDERQKFERTGRFFHRSILRELS